MRTLDDIIPPSRRTTSNDSSASDTQESLPRIRNRHRFPLGTSLVVLLILAASAGTLFYFSSAEVHLTPTTRTATVTMLPLIATAGTGNLTFTVISAEKVASHAVTSSGSKAQSSSASGTITISNTQKIPQKLITNTRFQATNGLVFRIHAPITVPAAKGTTPGSVTATAYADKTGSEYNIPPTSFTLPGLAGSPAFTQVTAKSATPMNGGASGNEPVVAIETEQATRNALMDSLRADLMSALQTKIPEGYVLLAGASDLSFNPLSTTVGDTAGMALVKEQGRIRAVLFKNSELARSVASSALPAEYKGGSLIIGATDGLIYKSSSVPTLESASAEFTLSGTVELISVIEPMRIASAVAGKGRGEVETILRQYPEVKRAVLILRPFWRKAFPQDPAGIKVMVAPPSKD